MPPTARGWTAGSRQAVGYQAYDQGGQEREDGWTKVLLKPGLAAA
jgi:hypothetical protein